MKITIKETRIVYHSGNHFPGSYRKRYLINQSNDYAISSLIIKQFKALNK